MFANFTEEACTGTGDVLTLAGATNGNLPFSASFNDGDSVACAVRDADGVTKVAGIYTFNAADNTITRADAWSWDGTSVDKQPVANIALSGGVHTITCTESISTLKRSVTSVIQETSGVIPARPAGYDVVHYYCWEDPQIDGEVNPYDQWVQINEIIDSSVPITLDFDYTEVQSGIMGIINQTQTAGRIYTISAGRTVWTGWITGTDAIMRVAANNGTQAGMLQVSVDGGARVDAAVSDGLYTLFSGISDTKHFVIVSTGTAYSKNAYFFSSGNIFTVTGLQPVVETLGNVINGYGDSLASLSGRFYDNPDSGYTPTKIPFVGNPNSIHIDTDATKAIVHTGDGEVYMSVDGADYVKYTNPDASAKCVPIELDGQRHKYSFWTNSKAAYGTSSPYAMAVNGTLYNIADKKSLVQFGDSITYGAGVSNKSGQVDTFNTAAYFGYSGATSGVSGETTSQLKTRLTSALPDVFTTGNDIAVLAIGRNDSAPFSAQVQADYLDCINQLRAVFSKVICRGVLDTGASWAAANTQIEAIVTDLADPNVVYVDVESWTGISTSDGTHPDQAGYRTIFNYCKTAYAPYLGGA